MRYWIKFSKEGRLKFISHRDMHKVVNRIIIRADLPVVYSKGFHPHQRISFSNPLELGIESKAEYLDLELREEVQPQKIYKALDENSPKGFSFYGAKKYEIGAPKLMAWLELASYNIENIDRINSNELEIAISKFLKKEEIYIEKRRRKRVLKVNIRSYIHSIELVENNIKLKLQTGQRGNLKVSQFIKIFNKVTGVNLDSYRILKTEMYGRDYGQYKTPFELLEKLKN